MTVRPVSAWPQEPLCDSDSQVLVGLLMGEMQGLNTDPEIIAAISKSQMSQLIIKRAAYHGLEITNGCILLVGELSEGNPGRAVQLLHALTVNTEAGKKVDVQTFCEVFPMGTPSEEVFIEAWDAQKGDRGENLLDTTQWARRE